MNPFTMLPEGCISEIISFTTPVDTIRSSVISRGFKAAAESDIVWDKFLPSDHQNIVSRSVSPILFDNKKDLYFRLSESPIFLDEGKMTVSYFGNTHLMQIQDIRGMIGTRELSPGTNYAAYLVFKVSERYHGLESTNAMVRFVNQENEDEAEERGTIVILAARTPRSLKGRLPEKRTNGWLEVEIGKFYNGDDNGDVEARLLDSRAFHAKVGLIIEGIEFRPI